MFPCPHCKKSIPGGQVDRRGRRKSFCPHCHAPVKFYWLPELLGYLLALSTLFSAAFFFNPFLEDTFVQTWEGTLDRSSAKNLILLLPFMALAALVQHVVHLKFGALVLANPKWPLRLSREQVSLMREHGISCNGEYFAHDEMHFDTLDEAIEYAQRRRFKPTA
jgi:hypothetical protein